MLKTNVIKTAIEQAHKSTCMFRVGAVIFNKKNIMSYGCNYSQRSVRSITRKFIRQNNSIHAEVCAIINAKQNLRRCSIFVVRINKCDEFRLAKPCVYCRKYLQFVGIKHIYYSTMNGIEVLNI